MCRPTVLPPISRVLSFVIFLMLTCNGRTIEECGDFLQVKVWRYRRQLLLHHSNIWIREVAAWESEDSFAYVLREATDGAENSYGAIFDETMTLRSCKVTDGYTEDGNTRLISDIVDEFDRNGTKFESGESAVLGTLLRADSHTATTFDEIVEMLTGEKVPHRRRLLRKHKASDVIAEDDHIRVANRPSKGSDGPSVEIYRNLPSEIPTAFAAFLDFEGALEKCNRMNNRINNNFAGSSSGSRWLPSPVRTGLEAVGILDPLEEEEDFDDVIDEDFDDEDELFAEQSGETAVDHHTRQKRGLFMFPGTLWCGTGNRAPNPDALGVFNKTDMCCREHDTTPSEEQFIVSGETKHHHRNWGMITTTHCSLDKRFHRCLRHVRTTAAYEVGRGYFNVFNVQCFVIRNRKQCMENYWYMPWKCKKHEYKPTACLRHAQVFPSLRYRWPS